MLGRCSAFVSGWKRLPMPVFWKSGLLSATGRPCERMNESPSAMSSIASVVMKGGRFSLTTGSALT